MRIGEWFKNLEGVPGQGVQNGQEGAAGPGAVSDVKVPNFVWGPHGLQGPSTGLIGNIYRPFFKSK